VALPARHRDYPASSIEAEVSMSKLARYRIRIAGHIDASWFTDLVDCTVTPLPQPETLIVTAPIDQASLFGLLALIRDLALPLLEVTRLDDAAPAGGSEEGERRVRCPEFSDLTAPRPPYPA
jgi:hypothetical protein